MVQGKQQAKELFKVSFRTFEVPISDADMKRFVKLAATRGLAPARILQNFVWDLLDGTYCNGPEDHQNAQAWFEHCNFHNFPRKPLLLSLLDHCYDPKTFLTVWELHQEYLKDPEKFCRELHEVYDPTKPTWNETFLQEMLDEWQPECTPDLELEVQIIKEYLDDLDRHRGRFGAVGSLYESVPDKR